MNEEKDILAEAIAELKNQSAAEQPPPTVVDETLSRLAEAERKGRCALQAVSHEGAGRTARPALVRLAVKLTAAAAVLVLAGYAIGKRAAPAPVDVEQLRDALEPSLAASLEPAIRGRLLEEMTRRTQLALANTYVQLREELTEQYRGDFNRFASQLLAASNTVTNELLAELLRSVRDAQSQDLHRVAQVLHELEMKRRQDRSQLAAGLQTLAYETEDELERTRNDLVRLLVSTEVVDDLRGSDEAERRMDNKE